MNFPAFALFGILKSISIGLFVNAYIESPNEMAAFINIVSVENPKNTI